MLKTWLSAYGVEALYERVHTTEDMRRFLSREGRDIATRYIHIICHGEDLSGCGTAKLCLTFDKLDLFKNCNVFENLTGKILIFSCCEIGNDIKAMEEVKRVSQAAAVICYRISVYDHYTNLAEVLLYDQLINTNRKPEKIVEQVQGVLREMEVEASDTITRKPVLICY